MTEAEELQEEGPEDQPVARNGEPVEPEVAQGLIVACLLGLFEANADHSRPLPVSGADPQRVEEAVQDAFGELYTEAVVAPEPWMSTPSEAATELLFAEWLHRTRKTLDRWRREPHQDRVAGLKRLRIDGDPGPAEPVSAPREFAWIEEEGLRWEAIDARIPTLADHESPVWLTLLLRWCTGWDARKIACSLDGDVPASEVFVRLVRLLRRHPEEWMALSSYCSRRHGAEELPARSRRRDYIDAVVERNGWCDPFAPGIREDGIGLLVDWMTRTGKLPDPLDRPDYEWPARAKRELVARRIATGFAAHPRTFSRKRLWAPPEGFTSIAGRLTMQREVSGDTARKYFERLRKDGANAWIADLLPLPRSAAD